jgi:hypothetical protein
MIPKTVAYLVIGFLAYGSLYRTPLGRTQSIFGDVGQTSQ